MVIVELKGGLGNQMFQYAAAIAYADNKHQVLLDLDFLEKHHQSNSHFTARKFELNLFQQLHFKVSNSLVKNIAWFLNGLKRFTRKLSLQFEYVVLISDDYHIPPIKGKIIILDGYFQNPLIFEHKREVLLEHFTFPSLPREATQIASLIESTNAVCIHVRRGDYTKPEINDFHGVLSKEYYEMAVNEIKKSVNEPAFFIFSDDIEWCKSNFSYIPSAQIHFVNLDLENWVDMKLMTLCKHHIIANSSFSWWGAWLNNNSNSVTIAPELWFRTAKTKIIPKKWKTI